MKLKGAEMIVKALEIEGIEYVFGIPGGAILPLCDALYETNKVKFVLSRHELWATHQADGYAKTKQDVGVCIVTSGPGGTNTLTGIANAYIDSTALVVLVGQVPTDAIGTDAFQETDMYGCTLPIVKHSFFPKKPEDIPHMIKGAFYIAKTGRKGPVVVILPIDVQKQTADFIYPLKNIKEFFPGYNPQPQDLSLLGEAVDLIKKAEKPVIIAGGGTISSGASSKLLEFIEYTNIPLTNTLMGKGAIPESHPLSLGLIGMHGHVCANKTLAEADLIIALGTRFSNRATGTKKEIFENKKIIHIDIDTSEINKNIKTTTSILCDIKLVIDKILTELTKSNFTPKTTWAEQVKRYKKEYKPKQKSLPQLIIEAIQKEAGKNCIVTTEVGQHQMWAALYWKTEYPGQFLTSGGLGTMGYGLPAAIGAYFANPDITPICISGDGSFFMNMAEIDTAVRYDVPIKLFVFNNKSLGMVRQLQYFYCDKRYAFTEYGKKLKSQISEIAKALGAYAVSVNNSNQITETIKKAFEVKGPVVVDINIPKDELVLPMATTGSIAELITEDKQLIKI